MIPIVISAVIALIVLSPVVPAFVDLLSVEYEAHHIHAGHLSRAQRFPDVPVIRIVLPDDKETPRHLSGQGQRIRYNVDRRHIQKHQVIHPFEFFQNLPHSIRCQQFCRVRRERSCRKDIQTLSHIPQDTVLQAARPGQDLG